MACSPLEIRASSNVSFFLAPASHDSSFVPCSSLCCSCLPSRLVSIGGGCWDTGGRRPRGPHLLAIPQNEPIPKCPKIPPKCPKTPRNPPKYVLQDYRGVGGRARLPPKPESLISGQFDLPYRTVPLRYLNVGIKIDEVTRLRTQNASKV